MVVHSSINPCLNYITTHMHNNLFPFTAQKCSRSTIVFFVAILKTELTKFGGRVFILEAKDVLMVISYPLYSFLEFVVDEEREVLGWSGVEVEEILKVSSYSLFEEPVVVKGLLQEPVEARLQVQQTLNDSQERASLIFLTNLQLVEVAVFTHFYKSQLINLSRLVALFIQDLTQPVLLFWINCLCCSFFYYFKTSCWWMCTWM